VGRRGGETPRGARAHSGVVAHSLSTTKLYHRFKSRLLRTCGTADTSSAWLKAWSPSRSACESSAPKSSVGSRRQPSKGWLIRSASASTCLMVQVKIAALCSADTKRRESHACGAAAASAQATRACNKKRKEVPGQGGAQGEAQGEAQAPGSGSGFGSGFGLGFMGDWSGHGALGAPLDRRRAAAEEEGGVGPGGAGAGTRLHREAGGRGGCRTAGSPAWA